MHENNQVDLYFDYPPPEETPLLPCGRISRTEVSHVYKLEDGFICEPYDNVVHVGNFCFFDETEQLGGVFDTFEQAVNALGQYCAYLDGNSP